MNRSDKKFRCIVIGYSFTLACKGYDNHHCHNKPPDRKWGWSVDDIMPRRDGPENLRILRKRQLRVEFLPLRQRFEFSTIDRFSWVFWISIDRDLKHHKMCHTLKWGSDSMVSIDFSELCLSPRVEKPKSELINCSYLKRQSPPVFVYVLNYCCDWYHYGYGYTTYNSGWTTFTEHQSSRGSDHGVVANVLNCTTFLLQGWLWH